jgi:hypothetical protein
MKEQSGSNNNTQARLASTSLAALNQNLFQPGL